MTAQPYNRFVFVSWSWHSSCNGNQAIFIQYITFYSIQIYSFNADIFIQYRYNYSIQIFVFNNLGPEAAKSHNLFLQLGGKHKLLGLRSFETQKPLVCKVKVAFDLFEMAVV